MGKDSRSIARRIAYSAAALTFLAALSMTGCVRTFRKCGELITAVGQDFTDTVDGVATYAGKQGVDNAE
jgi:hypothetical protein